jgi:hypothetical protein
MFQVQMQYIPGNDIIWVAQLTQEDPIYNYNTETEAQTQANELQASDSTGRQYRVIQII